MSRQTHRRFWWWVRLLVLASVIRGGWLAAQRESLRDDPDAYRQLARNLLAEGTFGDHVPDSVTGELQLQPTAYRPPLYPLLLAAVGWADGVGSISVAMLHWALGVATVLLVHQLSQTWGLGRWGWCAAVLVACDPILLNQSSLVMTETLAALLAVVGLLSLTRMTRRATAASALAAGAAVALAALCRPTFLVWGAAAALALMLRPWRTCSNGSCETSEETVASFHARDECGLRSPSARLWLAGSFILSAAIVLSPWAVRNVYAFGRAILTTTHGGYTLWLGNNPEFYRFLAQARWGDVWDSRHLDEQYLRIRRQTGHDELAADRWAHAQAMTSIRRQPASFARSCVWRVSSLWGLVPHRIAADESTVRRLARYAVGLWYLAVFGLALAGVHSLGCRLCRPPWRWGLLLCLAFTAMHAVYWSNLRMRAPLMPVVCLVAAVGVKRIADGQCRPGRVPGLGAAQGAARNWV